MKTRGSNFVWVGNHRGVDLVNTEAVDADGARLDLVPDGIALVDWAAVGGLIDTDLAQQCRELTERRRRDLLAWFRRLRSALRIVLESDDDDALAAADELDDVVGAVSVRLSYRSARYGDELPLDASGPLDRLRLALAATALSAARLDRSRIRRCGGQRCVLLYNDTTKNRSRRWCDMTVCGNRAKVSAHYQRARLYRHECDRDVGCGAVDSG